MSKVCEITGKKAMVGNNVSHSKRRTKRKFEVNLFYKNFFLPEENRWVKLRVSASGLRLINKIGVQAAIKTAQDKGLLSTKL
jgi:large subunit ribosomal protein L28